MHGGMVDALGLDEVGLKRVRREACCCIMAPCRPAVKFIDRYIRHIIERKSSRVFLGSLQVTCAQRLHADSQELLRLDTRFQRHVTKLTWGCLQF